MSSNLTLPISETITSPECFVAAVKSVLPSLRGYTRRLAGNDSDDLVQETLIRAWRARSRFTPGTNFKAWVFRIARNCFLSNVRRSARSIQWNPDVHDRLLVSGAAQDDPLYRRDLDCALAALPAGQREALLLITEEGLSYEDAARRAGQELGTLKSRVARARAGVVAYFSDSAVRLPAVFPKSINALPETPATTYERWKASGSRTIG
ncbi:ECF subfamily RNA polymerase sigma-70 factor [Sphingomonas aurantiaca]|uniref:ECF subfamily RNA polymerase sigma-70 factor n=1 Tax=Sphingomonas aurantiaca TaxID=185949 RepID=A0A5E8AKP0_9SPHN|nr:MULTISPECIES: sigma-70 family RNA polymerase sigma factor [Sphingomonas]VVT31474.1 ECF subfamily RNA polymerase sigma-70 factor [Sphingomonas aurantiaca]